MYVYLCVIKMDSRSNKNYRKTNVLDFIMSPAADMTVRYTYFDSTQHNQQEVVCWVTYFAE